MTPLEFDPTTTPPALGPLPRFVMPPDGWGAAWHVYTADQMQAERERCYRLGMAAGIDRFRNRLNVEQQGDGGGQ